MAEARPHWSSAAMVFAAVAAAAILIHASQALFGWGSGWVADLVSDWGASFNMTTPAGSAAGQRLAIQLVADARL